MARYSDEIIDDVRQSNDIVDVISQYVRLKRSGRNYFGLCPFHNEKSPSFSVSPEKQIFHCFGCGVGGNVFTFLTKIEGINFVEAVQQLAERANIQLPTLENNVDSAKEVLKAKVYKVNEFTAKYYHENLYRPESKMAQEYIKKRKLSNETLKSFQIGFSGKFDELYQELKKQGFEDREILDFIHCNCSDKFVLIVLNKDDLESQIDYDFSCFNTIQINTKDIRNSQRIKQKINEFLTMEIHHDTLILTSNLQSNLLESAWHNLIHAKELLLRGELELSSYELTQSLQFLGQIIKPYDVEEMLDSMFSQFCVGK